MNQTTMMMKIAQHLPNHECWFTPHYTDGLIGLLEQRGLLEWTIVGKQHKQNAYDLLARNGLRVDVAGMRNNYDLVVTCSDLFLPKNIRSKPIVLVQEGMTDPENVMYHIVRHLRLPRYLASTSTFGLSNAFDRLCVASEGYRDLFIRKGVDASRISVTGIPNFDDCAALLNTPSQRRGYVLVATSDARETFKYEHRRKTIERAVHIAAGRPIVFKLHPNEHVDRAVREINMFAPGSEVLYNCDINPLIAHCETLVTKYSSCVYVGIALGKEVYSDFPMDELRRLCPLQNGGTSAAGIARECEDVLQQARCNVFYLDRSGRGSNRRAS